MGHQSIISPVVKSNRTVLNLSRPYLARGIPTDIPDDHRKPVGLRSVIRDIARFRSASTSTCTCKLTDNRRQYLGNAAANPIYPILYDHPDNPFCSPLFEVDSRSPLQRNDGAALNDAIFMASMGDGSLWCSTVSMADGSLCRFGV